LFAEKSRIVLIPPGKPRGVEVGLPSPFVHISDGFVKKKFHLKAAVFGAAEAAWGLIEKKVRRGRLGSANPDGPVREITVYVY
jgi:hypothetical protein